MAQSRITSAQILFPVLYKVQIKLPSFQTSHWFNITLNLAIVIEPPFKNKCLLQTLTDSVSHCERLLCLHVSVMLSALAGYRLAHSSISLVLCSLQFALSFALTGPLQLRVPWCGIHRTAQSHHCCHTNPLPAGSGKLSTLPALVYEQVSLYTAVWTGYVGDEFKTALVSEC